MDGAFWEYRADHASEEHRFKKESEYDLSAHTGEVDQEYHDRYRSGTCALIEKFAAKRRYKYDSVEELVAMIEKKHPTYSVGYDKGDNLVVSMPDQED